MESGKQQVKIGTLYNRYRSLIWLVIIEITSALIIFLIMVGESSFRLQDLVGNPSLDTQIMILFFLIMYMVIALFGWAPLRNMQKAEVDFQECVRNIRTKSNSGQRLFAWDISKEITAKESIVRDALRDFGSEASRNTRDNDGMQVTLCDVQDFVNYDLITQKVANSHVAETIPGIMTGLGILGTFVGLTIGLEGFNAESTQAMTASIEPLIIGIKTAFYTSIAGVYLSVGYNLIYKRQLSRTLVATDRFIDSVYTIVPEPEAEARFRSLEEQFNLTKHLAGFAQDVGVSVSSSLNEIVMPAMREMNDTVANFANTSSDAQVEGIQKVTEKFIEQMNSSLGNSFEELGNTIHKLCSWQEESAEQMKKTVEGICNATADIEKANTSSREVIAFFKEYAESLTAMQNSLKNTAKLIQDECSKSFEIVDQQKTYFDKLILAEEQRGGTTKALLEATTCISEQTRLAKQQLTESQESLKTITNSITEQMAETQKASQLQSSTIYATMQNMRSETERMIGNMNLESEKMVKTITGEMQAGATALINSYNSMDSKSEENMQKTFSDFDSGISEIVMHLNGTLAETRDTLECVPRMLKEASDKFEKELKASIDTIVKITEQAKKTMLEVNQEVDVAEKIEQ